MSLITKIFFFHFQSCHERIVHPALLVFVELQKKSRQSTMWREIVEKEGAFDPRASILTYLSMSPLSIDYISINVQMMVEKLRPLNTCEVLVNCTIVCKTDLNYILTGSLGKKPLCSYLVSNILMKNGKKYGV